MNEKLIRLVLWLVCAASVGGFGWKIYDYVVHEDERFAPVDLAALEDTFGSAPARNTSHLDRYEEYRIVQDLNVTGYVEPVTEDLPEVPTVREPIEAADVSVPFIQLAGDASTAWIQPAGAKTVNDRVPGDLHAVGDRFTLANKPNVELEVLSIEEGAVRLRVVETGKELEVRLPNMNVEQEQILAEKGDEAGEAERTRYEPPETTRLTEAGVIEVGTRDAEALRNMSEEEILAAVPLRPARDPLSNDVIGLRVRDVRGGSVFERQGLQKDDIVLEVNGEPARNRDDLFQRLRDFEGDVLEVKIERRGGVRTLRYRLPR